MYYFKMIKYCYTSYRQVMASSFGAGITPHHEVACKKNKYFHNDSVAKKVSEVRKRTQSVIHRISNNQLAIRAAPVSLLR